MLYDIPQIEKHLCPEIYQGQQGSSTDKGICQQT